MATGDRPLDQPVDRVSRAVDSSSLHQLAPEGEVFGVFAALHDGDELVGLAETASAGMAMAQEQEPDQTLRWRQVGAMLVANTSDYSYTVRTLAVRRDRQAIRPKQTPGR